ncbi:hypothetical protein SAMN05421640_1855 [Ekhidna lutea]|uniref:Phosphagen kinase N-terminal domain-containing protein n=1 Tax=Ekhidna lutea TaxID=447679 RepID=A0A239IV30_EKHLU|nr:hypothetical protein [Ekhidna lutea]SNS97626.1 hypothetical protein SAMN05421640_1855 [Ekhidna lutea]
MVNRTFKKTLSGTFLLSMAIMLSCYASGYDLAIDWEVTTTAEVIEFPAWTLETDLMSHVITGEKYLLSEQYSGGEIHRNILLDKVIMSAIWIAVCLTLVTSTYLHRYVFFAVVALFALFLNRLNLFEVGLFGIQSRLVILIPSVLLIAPLVIFHEYKKSTGFMLRLGIMLLLSGSLLLGIDDATLFTDHFIANSLFGFTICGLLFLFIVSEELIFGVLFVVTSGKGGRSNHTHFLILSLIYLSNLTLYYLNKSGLYENSFFFFDPFILLVITGAVSMWSLKHKRGLVQKYFPESTFKLIAISLGLIMMLFVSHQMIRGNDAVYQAFHYFILYFHIGFGALFFLYIIGNFIDPLIKGFEVHKIVYKERNFPYASARLGGVFAVLAFYFLSGQLPYNLLKSGYYNYLAKEAETNESPLLAKEYLLQSSFLGYNTHYPNYMLGWEEKRKGAEYASKMYFHNAAQRFPSPYAWINYGNLDAEINPNKVQAIYEEALRSSSSGEIENNLGVLYMQKNDLNKSLDYFIKSKPSDKWNNAPQINKWNVLKKLEVVDSTSIIEDYSKGNFGVKNNILSTQTPATVLDFEMNGLKAAAALHKQAYLLNSAHLFRHDSVETLIRTEVENSSDGTLTNRLRKALALNLYKRGKINQAFLVLDYLQASAHQYYKGEFLDALGKFALDQEAYQLAIDFFDRAIEVKHTKSQLSRLEALARMGKHSSIPDELLRVLKKHPELTDQANTFLERLDNYQPPAPKNRTIQNLDTLSNDQLIALGRMNAFHEQQVIQVVNELGEREASGGYEILVDAIEINPYSTTLLKKYVFAALDWNLVDYADQTLERLASLLEADEFKSFKEVYEVRKQELQDQSW